MVALKKFFADFLSLFIPTLCITCGQKLFSQEIFLCLKCLHDIPRTNFHEKPENEVEQLFWGKSLVEKVTAWFFFKKGSKYQRLIHFLKYKGLKEAGTEMGRQFCIEVLPSGFFDPVDLIVPVPLHKKKLRKRGYNQSEWIAKGISKVLEIPIITENLMREKHTTTQTSKSRFQRWENVEAIFNVRHAEVFIGKHILLVDDVVTTGSTLEACASILLKIKNTRVSIATLAYAKD